LHPPPNVVVLRARDFAIACAPGSLKYYHSAYYSPTGAPLVSAFRLSTNRAYDMVVILKETHLALRQTANASVYGTRSETIFDPCRSDLIAPVLV
jgi:hypothetical protein